MKNELTISQVKQKLYQIPPEKLEEVCDFIDFILKKENLKEKKKVEKLEGIWEGLGFEKISNLDKNIREVRQKAETTILERISRCSI